MDSSKNHADAPAIRGWLLVLCVLLLVWQPANLAFTASRALDALAIRGLPLALVLAARILATGLGIAAGISILRHSGAAVAMTRTALTVSAAVDLFVYTTPYVPRNRVPGDTPWYVAASLLYYAVWMLYLARSQQVKALAERSSNP